MMTFRKLAANSDGKLIRAYLTEHVPEPEPGEAAIQELDKAVSAFPDELRTWLQEAAIATNARREAEQDIADAVRVSGLSPGM